MMVTYMFLSDFTLLFRLYLNLHIKYTIKIFYCKRNFFFFILFLKGRIRMLFPPANKENRQYIVLPNIQILLILIRKKKGRCFVCQS